MKIALVHDYLREYGGAERVLETLHEMWPGAPLYTSFYDWGSMGKHAERFKGWDIRSSWIQKYWFIKKWISPLRFLAPKIWESFDLSGYDVVISSSGWFMCRGVRTGVYAGPVGRVSRDLLQFVREIDSISPSIKTSLQSEDSSREALAPTTRIGQLHICYIHHPPRNLYGYPTGSTYQKYAIVRLYASIINFFLRHYDFETAQKVDYFIANSKETARRVEKFYRRGSTVIYPPVGISQACLRRQGLPLLKPFGKLRGKGEAFKTQKTYYLTVGRLAWSKQTDIIIRAANMLKLPLKIVGTGPEEKHLREIAGPTVEFLGNVDDEKLIELYRGARATIFSALDEDFGIVPVESMAVGTPVIGLAQGGVMETVIDGKTGVLFSEPTAGCLVAAIKKFDRTYRPDRSNKTYANCIKQAEKFSKERFVKEMRRFVEEKVKKRIILV